MLTREPFEMSTYSVIATHNAIQIFVLISFILLSKRKIVRNSEFGFVPMGHKVGDFRNLSIKIMKYLHRHFYMMN